MYCRERGASDGPPEGSNIITFYRNGFTVDNGPLRSFTDPENKPFLNAVEKGCAVLLLIAGRFQLMSIQLCPSGTRA